eukprot:472526_1
MDEYQNKLPNISIKRIETDESINELNENIKRKKESKQHIEKFIRIRRNKNSPTYSEDSELSESDDNIDSFTHKTWPRNQNWTGQKFELSENKIKPKKNNKFNQKKKRQITTNTATTTSTDISTEIIYKKKEIVKLANLTEENLQKMENVKEEDFINVRKSRNSKDYNEQNENILFNVKFKLKQENNNKKKKKKRKVKKKDKNLKGNKKHNNDITHQKRHTKIMRSPSKKSGTNKSNYSGSKIERSIGLLSNSSTNNIGLSNAKNHLDDK